MLWESERVTLAYDCSFGKVTKPSWLAEMLNLNHWTSCLFKAVIQAAKTKKLALLPLVKGRYSA